jgi:hypothetical protein
MKQHLKPYESILVALLILAGIHVAINTSYLWSRNSKEAKIELQISKVLQDTNFRSVENEEKIRIMEKERTRRALILDDLIKKVDVISHTVDRLDRTINPASTNSSK